MTVLNSNEKNLCTPGGKTGLLSEEETLHLISLAHQGEQEAKESLLRYNLRLVRSIVVRFVGRGVEFDDLFQIGSLGLLKAIGRFKPEVGKILCGRTLLWVSNSICGTVEQLSLRNLEELSVRSRQYGRNIWPSSARTHDHFNRLLSQAEIIAAQSSQTRLYRKWSMNEGSPITLGNNLERIEEN